MSRSVSGIVAVMLTPFHRQGRGRLFQSRTADRMVSRQWRRRLVRGILAIERDAISEPRGARVDRPFRRASGARARARVVVSGHVSDALAGQIEELTAMAQVGVSELVLVTNRLDPANSGTAAFRLGLASLLDALPSDLPLGLYEYRAPYRRLDERRRISRLPRHGPVRGDEGRELRPCDRQTGPSQ